MPQSPYFLPKAGYAVDMDLIYPDSPLYGYIVPQEPDDTDEPAPSIIKDDGTLLVRGDVNGDDAIDVIDLALVKKQILGKIVLEGDAFTLADINDDQAVDVIDLALVKKHILGKIDLFALAQEQQPTLQSETTTP